MVKRMMSLLTCSAFLLTFHLITDPPKVSAQNTLFSAHSAQLQCMALQTNELFALMDNYFDFPKNLFSPDQPTTYHNQEYGFTLQLPEDWTGHYRVEEYKSNESFLYNEETRFMFYYNLKNEDYLIFLISVYPDSKVEIDSEGNYGLLTKIASHNGLTYLWGVPSGIDERLVPEEQRRYEINFLSSKITEAKEIIHSFKLP